MGPPPIKNPGYAYGSGKDKSEAAADASDTYILRQTIENKSTFSAQIFATVSCQFSPLEKDCVDVMALYANVLKLKREMNHLRMKMKKL